MAVKILYEAPIADQENNPNAPAELNPMDEEAFNEMTENINERMQGEFVQPVSGRIQEIAEVEEILTRRTNNNVILVGEPGVGKTAIVEGLVQRILKGNVIDELKNAVIFELKFNDLMSGAGLVGALNEKVKSLVNVLKQRPNYILFIDEIHMIMTAGNTTGQTQGGLADQLKTELARGKIKVIGATTAEEYRKYIAPEGAFSRRFEKIDVAEPNARDTLAMMHNTKDYFKDIYGSDIDESAFLGAYDLAKQWYPSRNFPDKAISLLNKACSFHKSFPTRIGKEEQKLEDTIRSIKREIEEAKKSVDPNIASKHNLDKLEAELVENEKLLVTEKEKNAKEKQKYNLETNPVWIELQKQKDLFDKYMKFYKLADAQRVYYTKIVPLENKLKVDNPVIGYTPNLVTRFDVEHALANALGKSVDDISESFIDKAKKLPEILKKRVFGQDDAIEAISNAILRRAVGFSDENKPIGTFLLLGNTGVGKTETAKALAEALYGDEKDLISQPLENVKSDWQLTGAGAGFADSEKGSALVNALEKTPSAVILFDEFDKIQTRDVLNFFLNLLDEGYFMTGLGKKISLNNCVILLTANNVEKIYKEYPELLERLDDRIIYNDFNSDMLDRLINKVLNVPRKKAERKGWLIDFDDSVKNFLKRGFRSELGGRQISARSKKFVESALQRWLADKPKHVPTLITSSDLKLDSITDEQINSNSAYTNWRQNTVNNKNRQAETEATNQQVGADFANSKSTFEGGFEEDNGFKDGNINFNGSSSFANSMKNKK